MRRPRSHSVIKGATIHKMWRAHNKEFLLKEREDKLDYLAALKKDYEDKSLDEKFKIYAYVIMDNHVHELVHIDDDPDAFSNHMRRAHGKFGLMFNKKHNRLGKVAADRPKTLRIQDEKGEMQVLFYILANPVRAKKCKNAGNIILRKISAYRFYAYGETNDYTDMLTYPDWYMKLGRTPKLRQKKFRSLFDEYLRDKGLLPEPGYSRGFLIGDHEWVKAERKRYRGWWEPGWEGPAPPE